MIMNVVTTPHHVCSHWWGLGLTSTHALSCQHPVTCCLSLSAMWPYLGGLTSLAYLSPNLGFVCCISCSRPCDRDASEVERTAHRYGAYGYLLWWEGFACEPLIRRVLLLRPLASCFSGCVHSSGWALLASPTPSGSSLCAHLLRSLLTGVLFLLVGLACEPHHCVSCLRDALQASVPLVLCVKVRCTFRFASEGLEPKWQLI